VVTVGKNYNKKLTVKSRLKLEEEKSMK